MADEYLVYRIGYRVPCPRRSNGAGFGAEICIGETHDVDRVLRQRGIGETLEGSAPRHVPNLQGRHWFSDKLALQGCPGQGDVHTACFLSFLALSAQVASVDECLGDTGFLHELIHYPDLVVGNGGFEGVVNRIRKVEAAVPGLHLR